MIVNMYLRVLYSALKAIEKYKGVKKDLLQTTEAWCKYHSHSPVSVEAQVCENSLRIVPFMHLSLPINVPKGQT